MKIAGALAAGFLFLAGARPVQAAVVINEFLPNPVDEDQEWVEFYNPDNSSVDLSGYVFDDDNDFQSDSTSKTKRSLLGVLNPFTSCYWEISNYLNNDGDWPTLFTAEGGVVDDYKYTETSEEKSYARVPDGGDWQAERMPTKASANCLDLAPSPTPSPTPTASPTPTPTATATNKPTATPTVRPTTTPTVTPKPTATTSSVLAAKTEINSDGEVTVAAEVEVTPIPTAAATPQPEKAGSGKFAWLMIAGGGVLALTALFPFLRKWYDGHSWLKTFLKGGDRSSFGQE